MKDLKLDEILSKIRWDLVGSGLMDVLIIAGISKRSGGQFGVKQELNKDGLVMNYSNLQKYFGIHSANGNFSNFRTPLFGGNLLV